MKLTIQHKVRCWLATERHKPNPYTCRLLRRIEFLLLWLVFKHPYWSTTGRLYVGNAEFRTIFPDWMYHKAAYVQNKYPTTRFILSA